MQMKKFTNTAAVRPSKCKQISVIYYSHQNNMNMASTLDHTIKFSTQLSSPPKDDKNFIPHHLYKLTPKALLSLATPLTQRSVSH